LLDVALSFPLNGVLDAEKLFDTLVTEYVCNLGVAFVMFSLGSLRNDESMESSSGVKNCIYVPKFY